MTDPCHRCRSRFRDDPICPACYAALLERANGLVRENNDLQSLCKGLAERVAAQSELLSRRAEVNYAGHR